MIEPSATSPRPNSWPGVTLSEEETLLLEGHHGQASAMAMRIVTEAARLLGAERLTPIVSAHIDGCLYHGDGGVEFAERLVEFGGQVCVPTTLNVGALDLMHPGRVHGDPARRAMAKRLMDAYLKLGCAPTWTCAPYQAGHRPDVGDQVAWGESNAVAFTNSVLGARTNRYGDFLDIACALVGRAPYVGLHVEHNRRATILVDTSQLSDALKARDVFYPVLGSWLGRNVGDRVAAIEGLPADTSEDRLKALGAAAASTGAVALFHVIGVTPEAETRAAAFGGQAPAETLILTPDQVSATAASLSTTGEDTLDAVALGSPHFSVQEFEQLIALLEGGPAEASSGSGMRFSVPFYVCTSRAAFEEVGARGWTPVLEAAGVEIVVDTCVVVTPIMAPRAADGRVPVLMTNSGKFAHYGPGTIGYHVVYGSLEECVASAVEARVVRAEATWA